MNPVRIRRFYSYALESPKDFNMGEQPALDEKRTKEALWSALLTPKSE